MSDSGSPLTLFDWISRREAVRRLAVAPLLLSSVLARESQPAPQIDAKRFGCVGDGKTDDTDALQRALDAGAKSNVTVVVPKGDFLVNAERSLLLRDGSRVRLHKDAVLRAIANSAGNSSVLVCRGVRDVHVSGGRIVGERQAHLGQTGEWGMGVSILSAASVTLERLVIEDCWGDGVYVGEASGSSSLAGASTDITLRGVVARGNRRQGMSIVSCVGGLIEDCSFSQTAGTLPQSGVDVEPKGSAEVRSIRFRRCQFLSNQGFGLILGGNRRVSEIIAESCTSNGNGLDGFHLEGVTHCTFVSNQAKSNGGAGIALVDASENQIERNQLDSNVQSKETMGAEITIAHASSRNIVLQNVVRGPFKGQRRWMLRIDSADCQDNELTGNVGPAGAPDAVFDHGSGTRVKP